MKEQTANEIMAVVIIFCAVVLMVCVYTVGRLDGYRGGQYDALRGHWEYKMTTNTTVEFEQKH